MSRTLVLVIWEKGRERGEIFLSAAVVSVRLPLRMRTERDGLPLELNATCTAGAQHSTVGRRAQHVSKARQFAAQCNRLKFVIASVLKDKEQKAYMATIHHQPGFPGDPSRCHVVSR